MLLTLGASPSILAGGLGERLGTQTLSLEQSEKNAPHFAGVPVPFLIGNLHEKLQTLLRIRR